MPNDTVSNPANAPAGSQPANRARLRGDVIAFLFAPIFAVGYHLTVTILRFAGRRRA
jgi:hypothetical protein